MNKRYTKTRRRGQELTAKEGRTAFDSEERRLKRVLSQKKASFISVFRKVNSIIANREVNTRFASSGWSHGTSVEGNSPPAWTDGETIWMNPSNFDASFEVAIKNGNILEVGNTLARYKGLNYHELAHVLYSPRHTQKPSPEIRKAGEDMADRGDIHSSDIMWKCFNALEDQRIETMFVTRWSKAIAYFTKAVTDFILFKVNDQKERAEYQPNMTEDGVKAMAMTHILLHGRKYLPETLRNTYRELFVDTFDKTDAIHIESIIDQYRLLVFPEDSKTAVRLIAQLAVWMTKHSPNNNWSVDQLLGSVSGGHEHQRDSKPDAPSVQRAIRDKAEESDTEFAPSASSNEDESEEEDEEASSGKGTDSEGSLGGSITTDGEGSDSGTNTEGEASGSSGETTTHVDKELEEIEAELIKTAEDIASQVSSEIQLDVIDTLKSMKEAEDYIRDSETSKKHTARYSSLPAMNTLSARNQLTKALVQLRHDAEPSWARKQDTGRINIPAYMSSRGVDLDIFDQWRDEGEDATSIEVVILLDQSASMNSDIREASEALWMIKSACDVLDIACTVIGYSDDYSVLYSNETPAGKEVNMFPTIGATNPHGALEEAHKIFLSTDKRFKLLFSLTDGQWFDADIAIKQVKDLIAMGVKTDLIWLCPAWKAQTKNPFEIENTYLQENQNLGHQTSCVTAGVHNVVTHIKRNLTRVVQEAVALDV